MNHGNTFYLLRRDESPDLLHERDIIRHRVPRFGERRVPGIHAHVPRHEATRRKTSADEAAGAEPSVSETRERELHAAGRRGGLFRPASQTADRGANGSGAGQGNGAHANGGGEAEAEAEPHHRDGAMQLGKS